MTAKVGEGFLTPPPTALGRDIWLVASKTGPLESYRAFETEQEAIDHVNEEAPKFTRLVNVNPDHHLGGSLWEVRKIRLGRYEDGS